jgi:dCTP deaminase
MILADRNIIERCAGDHPMIVPFRRGNVQPASLDVTLSNQFRVFESHDVAYVDLADPRDTTRSLVADELVLHPGELVLGMIEEWVDIPNDVVARVEGKSSVGRLGLAVHVTAGFIDPGFRGNITLEMANLHPQLPILVRAGQLIAQLSFQQMLGAADRPYAGRYQDDTVPTASRYGAVA